MTSVIPHDVLAAMLDTARTCPSSDFAEVGVYQGGSAVELAKIAAAKRVDLWLYDTFSGMPFQGADDKHPIGDFSDTSIERIRQLIPDAIICPGIFPGTLHDRRPLGFVHCDVDQYRSTRDVITTLWPLLVPGGVMWFDDCELAPAMRAIGEQFDMKALNSGPQGRLWARKT